MQRKINPMIKQETTKLNVLFITPSFIYPPIGGDKIKPYKLIEYLASKHNLTFLCVDTEKDISEKRFTALQSLGIKVYVHYANFYLSAIKALIRTPFAGPIESEFYNSKTLTEKVKSTVNDEKIDLIINYFERTTEAVKHLKIPKILLAEDSRTLYQERTAKTSKSLLQKIKRKWELMKIRKYETELYDYFDVVTFVSDTDINYAKTLNNSANYVTVSNGVDLDKFKSTQGFEFRKDIYFIGKLDVWVNQIMIERLIKEIFPSIKSQLPEVKLFIVGFNANKELLKNLPKDVFIIDSPELVIPYYEKARLFIHPQFEGSGIQNKLLEALAMSCPVVTTLIGSQGINIEDGKSGLISNNNQQIISDSIEILTNDQVSETISINGRKLVEQNYSWDKVFAQIDSAISFAMKSK